MATPEVKNNYEATLDSYLSKLKEDKGGVLFIPVEAGADKKPISDLREKAKELGYDFRTADVSKPGYFGGQALPEDAKGLRVEDPTKLLQVIVQYKAGKMNLASYKSQGKLDQDILSSMVGAVDTFTTDTIQQDGQPVEEDADGGLQKGNYRIITRSETGRYINAIAFFTGKESKELEDDLDSAIKEAEEKYKDILPTWDKTGNIIDNVAGIEGIIKTKLFDSNKYTGERDIDSFKYEQARRNDKTLQILENRSAKKSIVLYLNNLEQIDETNAAALTHIIRSAPKSKIFIVGSYEVDSLGLEEELGNDNLREIKDEHKDKIQYMPLYSPEGFEKDLQDKFKDAPESAAQFLAIAAAAKSAANSEVLSKAAETFGIDGKTIINCIPYLIENKLLKDWKPANSKIAKKALEAYTEKQEFYKTVAEVIESVYGRKAKQFSPLLAELYESAKDEAKVIEWAKVAAKHFADTSNFESAIKKYQQVFGLLKDKAAQMETLERKLDVENVYGNSNLLEEDGEKVYNLAKEFGDKRLQAKALLAWCGALKDKYRNDAALPKLDEAITLLTELNQKNGLAEAHYHRAASFVNVGKHDEALKSIVLSEEFARETNNKKMLGNVLNMRALIYKSEKNYEEAEKTFIAAKEIFEEINDFQDVGKILNNLASLYVNTKNFKKAIEIGEEGSKKLSDVNYLLPVPALLQTLAAAYEELGDLTRAKEALARAGEHATRIGNTKIEAYAKYSQGVYSGGKEREKFFEETAEILQKHPLKSNEAAPLTKSVEEEVVKDVKRWLTFAGNLEHKEKIKAILEDLLKSN
jgi:tetratricopeptide (TPR) repeat protein